MTGQGAISYIENYTWSTTRLGLERTRELLRALGDPQKKLRFVHVAGSNGKGSTCAMLAAILKCAGYRTGLYTSPYIIEFCERIQINGENIPTGRLAEITERVKGIADAMEDHPSQFELVTAVAMEYFYEEMCDIVVLEVGMGGALDSTNAIDIPEVAVITNIGLEHTEYLGKTLEAIAQTKSGIIKPGCHAVCYDGAPEVTEVVHTVCKEKNVPLRVADYGHVQPISRDLYGQRFTWNGREYMLPLLGEHQLRNAATVLETIAALRERGWDIPEDAVTNGLSSVRWIARFEVLCHDPLCILDGGHNPQCAEAMAGLLRDYLPETKVTFILGVLADKDYRALLRSILPHAGAVMCLTPDSSRAMDAADLAKVITEEFHLPAKAFEAPHKAVDAALRTGAPIVGFGSLYMVGALRKAMIDACKKSQRSVCMAARKALTHEQREAYDRDICNALITLPQVQSAKMIFSYMAYGSEVDLTAFHVWAAAHGKRLAFPISLENGQMLAAIPASENGWETGKYGIASPIRERAEILAPEEIDAILVPCVGFDAQHNRLGHGGGYYDRYLPQTENAAAVLIAYEAQRLEKIVCDMHDRIMPVVITERRIY